MEHLSFVGEHLWIGFLGKFSIFASFSCALGSVFFMGSVLKKKTPSPHKVIGNSLFLAHTFFLLMSFALLLGIILFHYFEYKYAWQHSSKSLPFKYLLSSVWEGQEGSFLLWAVWHGILGSVLILRKHRFSSEVIFFISIAQVMIGSMLLGVYVGDVQIGSNPFILMRDFYTDAPIFRQANYLATLQDGNGLNELLQNYWMVIHPPILFLGYALTILPAGFAFAGLWTMKKNRALRAAQPWTLLAVCVLGLGIMMGGAWAYESLSFGGYWAWDPVENASLVPWLVLVAGLHNIIISLKRKKAYKTSYLLLILSFGFVLYASYLTRSGILGDTSVHAFTDLEMGVHLLVFLMVSFLPLCWMLIRRWRSIKSDSHLSKEDEISSREFWLSVGGFILFFSSLYIIVSTSLPVINKVVGTQWTLGKDPEFSYNRVMIWVAVFILLLSAGAYFLKFKKTHRHDLRKVLLTPILIFLFIALGASAVIDFSYLAHGVAFNTMIRVSFGISVFALCLQCHYFLFFSKKKKGGILSHIGFSLLIIGALLSSAKKEVLSYNYTGFIQDFGEGSAENPMENVTLIKDISMPMLQYKVRYAGDSSSASDHRLFFKVDFTDTTHGTSFRLYPSAFINPKGNQGLLSNPDKKHYWTEDIFVYITSMPSPSETKHDEIKEMQVRSGDTLSLRQGYVVLSLGKNNLRLQGMSRYFNAFDTTIAHSSTTTAWDSIPIPHLQATLFIPPFQRQNPSSTFRVNVKDAAMLPYITLKVYRFPYINLFWFGVLVFCIGTFIAWLEHKKHETH